MRKPGRPATIIPPLPQVGDTIGIVASASNVSKDQLEKGCAALHQLGYRVFFFESILEQDLYFAGTHERRAWELEQMFLKDYVKGIICARGGYGTNHLLRRISLDIVRSHPKMFMGYSDVTTLLTWICDQTDMVTYHGPMVAKDFAIAKDPRAFMRQELKVEVHCPQIKNGSAEGILYGGCLSLLAASLGTPYEIDTDDTVLFLEDVGAKPYQIDRMLMQLKLAGKLDKVKGVVFGEMPDCIQPGGQDYTLQQVIARVLDELEIPVGLGVRSGHLKDHSQFGLTLPVGIRARIEVSPGSLELSSS